MTKRAIFNKNRGEYHRAYHRALISFLDMCRKSGGLTLWMLLIGVPIGIALYMIYLWGYLDGYDVVKESTLREINVSCPTVKPCMKIIPAAGALSTNY